MAQTPEGRVKDKVKRLLKKHKAWNFSPVSAGMGVHGIPDIICCHHGVFIGIECKAPGKKSGVTALQRLQLDGIARAGGLAFVISSDDGDIEELDCKLGEITRAAND